MTQSATGKRYADLPDVSLRFETIPSKLRPLIADATKWAIVGDTGVERAIKKASLEEMESVVSRAEPLKEEIWEFAYKSKGAGEIPIPHEVVLFQMFVCILPNLETSARLLRKGIKL